MLQHVHCEHVHFLLAPFTARASISQSLERQGAWHEWFRRSRLLPMQGECLYVAKVAVEMQKYVILITDVPLAHARAQVADELHRRHSSEATEHGSPMNESFEPPPEDSRGLTHDTMQAFMEQAHEASRELSPRRSGWPRLWSRNSESHQPSTARRSSCDSLPLVPPLDKDSMHVFSQGTGHCGHVGAVCESAQDGSAGLRGNPVMVKASMHTDPPAIADWATQPLLCELGISGGGAQPVSLAGMRSADLRSTAAREHLGSMLKRTGWLHPAIISGKRATQMLSDIFSDVTLPPALEQELQDWADRSAVERAKAAQAGLDAGLSLQPPARASASAIGEGAEEAGHLGNGVPAGDEWPAALGANGGHLGTTRAGRPSSDAAPLDSVHGTNGAQNHAFGHGEKQAPAPGQHTLAQRETWTTSECTPFGAKWVPHPLQIALLCHVC
jgi:hypothetical protein